MSTQADERPMPPRIVHLLGGLRAIDDRETPVRIEAGHDQRLAQFPTPPYADLYRQLMALGLQPVGAEFVNRQSYEGLAAPDWQCASPGQGFKLRVERDLWAGVRHAAINSGDLVVRDLAERASTYLDLLPIRVFQLSEAYNQTLRAFLASGGGDSIFFQNTFGPYIDAAIHGFVADAASFRDIIAEAVWKLIVKEAGQVTTLATFLKRAKLHPHKLVQTVIAAGREGGWLRKLSDLRNHITHVAPVGRSAEFHMCQPRKVKVGPKIDATILHYPLLEASGALRAVQEPVDFSDEAAIKARLQEYKSYCDASTDALDYASSTLNQLVGLLAEAYIVIKNVGKSPALDVYIKLDTFNELGPKEGDPQRFIEGCRRGGYGPGFVMAPNEETRHYRSFKLPREKFSRPGETADWVLPLVMVSVTYRRAGVDDILQTSKGFIVEQLTRGMLGVGHKAVGFMVRDTASFGIPAEQMRIRHANEGVAI